MSCENNDYNYNTTYNALRSLDFTVCSGDATTNDILI